MMIRTLARRGATTAALSALAAAGLASVPGAAHAAVEYTSVDVDTNFHDYGGCTVDVATPAPSSLPWSDNGVAVSNSASSTATVTGPTPTDVTHLSARSSATLSSTPIGTGSATIKASMRLSAESGTPPVGTTCSSGASATTDLEGTFTLAQPRWATITVASSGSGLNSDLEVQFQTDEGTVEVQLAPRGEGSVSALLPAGEIDLDIEGTVDTYTGYPDERRGSLDSRVTITLQPVGSASAATGKGQAFAQLGARACPSGTVGVAITKKAARQAKRVQVSVNGRTAVTLKGRKLKKRTLVLPAASGSRATVAATITLKNGKKATVSRSYLACS